MLTAYQLSIAGLCDYATAERWAAHLDRAMGQFAITTGRRQAAFLAQCAHESGGFRVTVENLNYSVDGLLRVFRKYFTPEQAAQYARQPERIASRVYANRMGNGAESTKEGWKYRGRGLLQATGKDMYVTLMMQADEDFVGNPDLLAEPRWAAWSAGAIWEMKNLNGFADAGNIDSISRRINGGENGLEDRRRLYEQAREVFTD